MNRKMKYCKKYHVKKCYTYNKFNYLNYKINNIYYRLYQTGCALDALSKACNVGKIYCGIQNLLK